MVNNDEADGEDEDDDDELQPLPRLTLDRMRRMTVKAATDHTEVKWLSLSVMRMTMSAIPACSAAVRSAATASTRKKKTQAYKANISHILTYLVKNINRPTDQLASRPTDQLTSRPTDQPTNPHNISLKRHKAYYT